MEHASEAHLAAALMGYMTEPRVPMWGPCSAADACMKLAGALFALSIMPGSMWAPCVRPVTPEGGNDAAEVCEASLWMKRQREP